MEHGLKNETEKECEQSKGGKKREVMWWWNKQVAEVIKRKKDGYKKWRKDRSEENLEACKVLKKEARREVASAKEKSDIIGMPPIQDKNGKLKTEISERLEVWRRYCKRLMNVENDWDGEVDCAPVEGSWQKVSEKVW